MPADDDPRPAKKAAAKRTTAKKAAPAKRTTPAKKAATAVPKREEAPPPPPPPPAGYWPPPAPSGPQPIPPSPRPATPYPHASNQLAMIALVCSILGITLVPMVGGVIGATLGALALRQIAIDPEHYRGRNEAIAALAIGVGVNLIPLSFLLFVSADRVWFGWFVLSAAYAAGVVAIGIAFAGRGQRSTVAGAVSGATMLMAIAMLVTFLLILLFAIVVREIGNAVTEAIGEAFRDAFDFNCTSG